MTVSRRTFLQRGSVALAAASIPFTRGNASVLTDARQRFASLTGDDDAIRTLITTALEAARAAGAVYADARYTVDDLEYFGFSPPFDAPYGHFITGIGVRALYQGYWGYAALEGVNINIDAVARMGRQATLQAKTGAKGPLREIDLAPAPVVDNGHWTTPIEIDPFTVSWEEKWDVAIGLLGYPAQHPYEGNASSNHMRFDRVRVTFGSTAGSFFTKTIYRTGFVGWGVGMSPHWRTEKFGSRSGDGIVSRACAGWEYILKAPLEAPTELMLKQANDARFAVPVDIGRYDIVFDGTALAAVTHATLGRATELDRAMGYTANMEGTSYINQPLAMVGDLRLGSAHLNLTANRTMPRGLATVKWDDEGVEPDDIVLVKDGILTDFQTTRESAGWLRPYYEKTRKPFRSHGGALGESVGGPPIQGAHNLMVSPATSNTSFEALCAQVDNGLAVLGGSVSTDQQALNGTMEGDIVYEIKNGKLGRVVEGAVLLLRSPEFWKNLEVIGGSGTLCSVAQRSERVASGGQQRACTVMAPAGLVKKVAVSNNVPRVLA